jgi:PAS domain S-box-containing protein
MKKTLKNAKLRGGRQKQTGLHDGVAVKPKARRVAPKSGSARALNNTEPRYQSLFDNMLEGCQVIGFDWRYLYVNATAEQHNRRPKEELLGKKYMDMWPGIETTEVFAVIKRCLEARIAHQMENEFVFPDGSIGWFSLSIQPVPEGVFILSFNITERKQAEEMRRYLAAIVEASDDAIIGKTLDGTITSWNSGAERLYGYSAEGAIGQDITLLIPPDRPGEETEIISRIRRGESVEHFETIRLKKDGTRLDVSITVSPIKDASGQIVGASSIGRDITSRKRVEEELQKAHDELELQVQERTAALSQSNMLLQTLLDNMPDQIYFKDRESRFIKNSRAQAEAMGFSDPAQIVGKTDFDFFPHAQRSYEEEQEIIRSGKPLVDFEEWVVWPDGHGTWVSTTKVPLRDREDKIIGTFGISRDITERKRNEEALQKAVDELDAFSYSISHDLRAPLRGIDGWSLALLEDYGGQLDEQGKEYINRVRAETQHMGELIDDLLKLSRITRAEMSTDQVDLSARARSIAARLQAGEPQRQVEFIIQNDLQAKADARLMDVALTNLLGNAFKFTGKTPEARIEFGQMNLDGERVFFVRDNGAGFDMAYSKKLFGAFQRMHKTSEFPGTGIGLATVQRIIHRHGGRVWAEAAPDKGATFFFTIEEKI